MGKSSEAIELSSRIQAGVVLLDCDLRDEIGLLLLREIKRRWSDSGILMVTDFQRRHVDPPVEDIHVKLEYAIRDKWDWALPPELRLRSYVSAQLDTVEAQQSALALSQIPDAAAQ